MESTARCPAVVSTVQLTRPLTARRAGKMLIPLGAMGFQASGHGVCGVANFSLRSVMATGIFMLTAMSTVVLHQVGFG